MFPTSHVPPFWQGLGLQSSTFVSQSLPMNPAMQLQVYWSTPSCTSYVRKKYTKTECQLQSIIIIVQHFVTVLTTQVPSFVQGLGVQSSMFISHTDPVHPIWHKQVYDAIPSYTLSQSTKDNTTCSISLTMPPLLWYSNRLWYAC